MSAPPQPGGLSKSAAEWMPLLGSIMQALYALSDEGGDDPAPDGAPEPQDSSSESQ
jgi:hypothetical protein